MGILADKRILITGLLSNRSIAYGVAQAIPPAYTEWIGGQLMQHLAIPAEP